jgi:hypothetical protein
MRDFRSALELCAICAAVIVVNGCAPTSNQANQMTFAAVDPPKKSDPPPDVSHCALVTISSPVLYACNGKIYSEHQLARIREQVRQQQASEAANQRPTLNPTSATNRAAIDAGAANGKGQSGPNSHTNVNSTANTTDGSKM